MNISSNAKSVSVHQYTADAFADVLDPKNKILRVLLQKFQENGNLRDFGAENAELLKTELKPYYGKICTVGNWRLWWQSAESASNC